MVVVRAIVRRIKSEAPTLVVDPGQVVLSNTRVVEDLNRDGKRVVTASSDNTTRIWDAESGKEIAVLKGHKGSVRGAAFSGDGGRSWSPSW